MTNSKLIEQIQRYILILILLFLATGCVSLDNPTDIFQGRENGKTPSPSPDCIIGQTFISRKANLNVIEVLLTQPDIIRVSPQDDTQEDIQPIITLHLRSTSNLDDDLRTVSIDTSYVFHPIVRFSFPPIPDSQEQSYYFFLSGTSSDALLLKYADIDMYHDGVYMLNHREEPGDLWFRTYYDYDLACVMRDIATYLTVKIGFSLKIMLIAIALLFLPGAGLLILMKYPFPGAARKPYLQMRSTDILFTHGHRENSHDILIWLGLSFGLSLALAPLLILWTTTLGLRLGKVGIIIYLIVSGVIVVYGIVKHYPKRNMTKYDWAWGGVCAFIILLGIILRFVQIHDLVLPAWVDPVHHTMIARLIADSGHVPDTFRPFIPNDYFYYHYGFHTIAAYFQWLSDLEMSQVLLILGQILNVGAILVSYLLAKGLTGRRMIGVWSMIITGFIASMPAYYVTWGRYTQLTGLIILPATIVLTMWWLESDNSKFDWRRLILVVISWAGLFLTHYRVLFFAIAFLVVYVVYVVLMYRSNFTWLKWFIIRGASMVGLSMLFALPWLIRVVNQAIIRIGSSFPTSIQSAAETNTVPLQYIFSGQEYILVALAIGGAVWGILRGEHGIILLIAWFTAIFMGVNPSFFGLPNTWLVSNISTFIILYIPFGIAVGYLFTTIYDYLRLGLGTHWQRYYQILVLLIFPIVAMWGAWQQVPIINPITILTAQEDMEAMTWIRENTPPSAVFLVNTTVWMQQLYMGNDAGWWISVLADRQTTLPSGLYGMTSLEYTQKVGDLAKAIAEIENLDDVEMQTMLDEWGVTHVYIGAKGGSLTPWMLLDSDNYNLAYTNGAVWIFEKAKNDTK